MFQVEKRDGTIAEFQMKKITDAIGKAFGAKDMQFSDDMLQMLALRVTADFQSKIKDGKISVESIQDSVENVLIQCGYAEVAKAYGIPALRMLCDAVREEAPEFLEGEGPKLLEVMLEHGTFAYPKTCLGEPIHNQQPYAPKEVYDRLMEL